MKKFLVVALLALLFTSGCSTDVANPEKFNKTVTNFELPYTLYSQPVLIDQNFYLGVSDKSEYINKIIKYNLSNRRTEVFFQSEFKESTIHTIVGNKEWLVWVDSKASGELNKIYAQNLKTGTRKILSISEPGSPVIHVPFLYEDYASWINTKPDGKSDVVLYNLQTNQLSIIEQIKTHSLYNNFVHMNNGKLLWTDSENGKGYYKIYNLETKVITTLEAPLPFPGYAFISKNTIFSINFQDHRNWSSQELGSFDIQTKKYTKLKDKYLNGLKVSDNIMALINSEQILEVYEIINNSIEKKEIKGAMEQTDFIDFSNHKLIAGRTDLEKKKLQFSIIEF